MKALTVNLQEQHVCYCAEYMSAQALQPFFITMRDLSNAVKTGNPQPTDLVGVTIDPDLLLQMHAALGGRPEFQTAAIHAAIKAALLPQLLTIAGGEDADAAASAQYVLQTLQTRDAQADQSIQDKITTGRNILKS